jgi:hypothetical protein
LSPYCCAKDNRGINRIDDKSQVGGRTDHVGCFDDRCNTCGNDAAGSLIHGYALREGELFSFLFAAFYPW